MLDDKDVIESARKWARRFASRAIEYHECFNVAYLAGKELNDSRSLNKCMYHTLLKFKLSLFKEHKFRDCQNCSFSKDDIEEVSFIIKQMNLSQEDKTLLSLKFNLGLNQSQIAQVTNQTQSMVSEKLNRIIGAIQDKLKERNN